MTEPAIAVVPFAPATRTEAALVYLKARAFSADVGYTGAAFAPSRIAGRSREGSRRGERITPNERNTMGRTQQTDAELATAYGRTAGTARPELRHRPAWHASAEYRELITRRIDRDKGTHRAAVTCRDAITNRYERGGPHINGACGGGHGRLCDDCSADAVQLLRAWAERELAPPIVAEEPRRYWLRVGGPQAERWALVARVLVLSATTTEPLPVGWIHCGCCGFQGLDDGRHRCEARGKTRSWHGDAAERDRHRRQAR